MIVYKTTNLINNKIYIGQDRYNNPKYLGSGKLIIKAIKKYGKENFKKEIIETCSSFDCLDLRETYWINYFNSNDKTIGYNLTLSGRCIKRNFGSNNSKKEFIIRYGKEIGELKYKEYCNSIGKKHKNIKKPYAFKCNLDGFINKYGKELGTIKYNIYCEKISKSKKGKSSRNKGKTFSEETRKKQSEARKKLYKEGKVDTSGSKNGMYGKKGFRANLDGFIDKYGKELGTQKYNQRVVNLKNKSSQRKPNRVKSWLIKTPLNETITIENLNQFCRDLKVTVSKFKYNKGFNNYILIGVADKNGSNNF